MPDKNLGSREWLRSSLEPSPDCPPLEKLDGFIAGTSPEIAVHVRSCAYCATELEMLRTFQSNEIPAHDAAAVQKVVERLAKQPLVAPRIRSEERRVGKEC